MSSCTTVPRSVLVGTFGVVVCLAGCESEAKPPPAATAAPAAQIEADAQGEKTMKIEIASTAFSEGKPIPKKFTGEGEDVSPALAWKGLPEGTRELALICDDPDAPRPEPWVHWLIYKLPADTEGLPEGVPADEKLKEPAGALQGKNSWPTVGYRGPMPPPGHGTHRYFFKLYALDEPLEIEPGVDKQALLKKMEGHVLAEGQLMGTYER